MHTYHAIIKKTPKGGDAYVELNMHEIWGTLLAPILVGVAVASYSEWIRRKK